MTPERRAAILALLEDDDAGDDDAAGPVVVEVEAPEPVIVEVPVAPDEPTPAEHAEAAATVIAAQAEAEERLIRARAEVDHETATMHHEHGLEIREAEHALAEGIDPLKMLDDVLGTPEESSSSSSSPAPDPLHKWFRPLWGRK